MTNDEKMQLGGWVSADSIFDQIKNSGPRVEKFTSEYMVDHPSHYGGGDNPYEAIKVIEAWGLGFCLGNALKYVSRAGKKPGESMVKDLEKAVWYIQREIDKQRREEQELCSKKELEQ